MNIAWLKISAMNRIIAFLLIVLLLIPSPVFAWSEGGHHLIAAVAFSLLTEKEQAELIAVLQKHPRYAEDFVRPPKSSPTTKNALAGLLDALATGQT